ncbi:hypothetical protein ACFX2I_022220 [Malus domestica]|uniref:PdxS/SNZ N-terminal domain-containing protein n=1 Tax=Malus domestica TaxID=3750 RepID=A0A498HMH8_MALDO|nr:hypothetical protein DVH24_013491 [Malus domestica]
MSQIRLLNNMDDDEVFAFSKTIQASYDLVAQSKQMGRLPVVLFATGGIVTPADAALTMQFWIEPILTSPRYAAVQNHSKPRQEMLKALLSFMEAGIDQEAAQIRKRK